MVYVFDAAFTAVIYLTLRSAVFVPPVALAVMYDSAEAAPRKESGSKPHSDNQYDCHAPSQHAWSRNCPRQAEGVEVTRTVAARPAR